MNASAKGKPLPKKASSEETPFELSNELERQLLGSLLNWPEMLMWTVGVSADSFVALHHGAIWEALVTLHEDAETIDLVSVLRRLDGAAHLKRFSQLGGAEAYLAGLATCVDDPGRVPELIRAIRGEHARRKLSLPRGQKAEATETAANQTADLMALFVSQEGEVFRSHDDKPLVCLTDKARRTVTLQQAVRLLCLAYYRWKGRAVGSRSKEELTNLLSAMADDGEKRPTWIRIAEHDGALYLDLGDESWRAIRITASGWETVERCPVHFLRPAAMRPLPMPERGGSIGELFGLCNLPDGKSQALALGWLVAAFRPGRPLPLLVVTGKQGCAKSTTAKMLSSIIDPKSTGLRTKPKDEETVMVAAQNSWVLAYDNLSSVPDWLSDLLCCLSTGTTYTARQKYTDMGETVMEAMRPVILTSINDIARRSDLLDRTVILSLPTIEEEDRRAAEEVWADFEAAHGRILGVVLDAVSVALGKVRTVKPRVLPRMADFARWAMAAEEAFGFASGDFVDAYTENRLDSHAQALEDCPIVEPIERAMVNLSEWVGTASDLLDELERRASKKEREHRRWPKDGARLSGELQRIAPNLRAGGFEFRQSRESGDQRRRIITIYKLGEEAGGERLQPRHQRQAQLVD